MKVNTTMRSVLKIYGELLFVKLCSVMLGSRDLRTIFLGWADKYLRTPALGYLDNSDAGEVSLFLNFTGINLTV